MRRVLIVTILAVFAVGMIFAGGSTSSQSASKGQVDLVYVEWAREVAITYVAGDILTRLGYDVNILSVANAAMWAAVASGDADAHLSAWLPATHAAYYGPEGEYTSRVEDLGPSYYDAKLGLVVPAYVPYDSIAQAAANADSFGGMIIGIDPGAGMMQQTEAAIEANTSGLAAFELLEGSDATMTAALGDAIRNEEYIIVPGWQPHWMFGRWDLKILDDPDGIYGASENIHTIARLGLQDDLPEVYQFLNEFDWTQVDLGGVLVANQDGVDPEQSAKDFVDANIDLIRSLLPSGLSL